MLFSSMYRHSFQNPLLCILGKQIFNRSSGIETGEKKSASGERLAPGLRDPRSPVMDVLKRNGTFPSGERPPEHRGPSVMKREFGQQASAPLSLLRLPDLASQPVMKREPGQQASAPLCLPRLPGLASQPVRVDKCTSLCERPVSASTNKPVLDLTHVPVQNKSAGQHKSAGRCFLPKAEEKTSVSGVNLPGHRRVRSPKHFMEVPVKNITYPSCESEQSEGASLSTNMPVPVKAGQMSITGERPPGHRGPSVMKREPGQQASAHLSILRLPDLASQPVMKGEPGQQASAPLCLPRLPSFASKPVQVDKCTSLCERPVASSTNKPVLDLTHVPVKPEAGQNKSAGQKKTSVSGVRLPDLRGVRSPGHFMGVSVKNITYPSCESEQSEGASLYRVSNFPARVDRRTPLRQQPVAGERPPVHRGTRTINDVMEREQAIAPLSLPRVRVDKRTYLCERPVSMNVSGLKITCSCEA